MISSALILPFAPICCIASVARSNSSAPPPTKAIALPIANMLFLAKSASKPIDCNRTEPLTACSKPSPGFCAASLSFSISAAAKSESPIIAVKPFDIASKSPAAFIAVPPSAAIGADNDIVKLEPIDCIRLPDFFRLYSASRNFFCRSEILAPTLMLISAIVNILKRSTFTST